MRIWDVAQAAARVHLTGHGDVVQSISWRGDGTVLASTCKDTKLRIWDPRASASAPAAETVGHVGVKASVALWLGDLDRILTTGFTKVRLIPRHHARGAEGGGRNRLTVLGRRNDGAVLGRRTDGAVSPIHP